MTEFVNLRVKRNRSWPWPEQTSGLSSMFGDDGWCRTCAIPKHSQTGPLTLQRKGVKVEGGWVPNWLHDVLVLSEPLANEVRAKFDVELRPVAWHASTPGDASQLIIPTVSDSWFDPEELSSELVERHGSAGKTCPECGTWRWMPLVFAETATYRFRPGLSDATPVVASPEWFGDGKKSFRQVLLVRELAELIAAASPKDFRVRELPAVG